MERLLITGASGFLGGNLAAAAASSWQTHLTRHARPVVAAGVAAVHTVDLTERDSVRRLVGQVMPHAIIHAAAEANVGVCANNPQYAWNTNVLAAEHLAEAAEEVQARMVFVSTDLVFDGGQGHYAEHDDAVPLSYYGRTKREAETRVLGRCSNRCVVRSSLLFGWSQTAARCFSETMIAQLEVGQPVRLFTDEYRTPLYVLNLSEILLECAARDDLQGILHAGGPERLSRFDFAMRVCQVFGFAPELLVAASRKDPAITEPRPEDCSLNTDRARKLLATPIVPLDQALFAMRQSRGRQ